MSRPPYVDPNTNIIYDTDNAEYEGFLTKQSMWLKVRLVAFLCSALRCAALRWVQFGFPFALGYYQCLFSQPIFIA